MTAEPRPAPPAADPPPPGEPWTVLRLILWSAGYLEGKGVERGRLDAEHLLADALGTERLQLYLQYDRPLTPEELASYKERLLRRADREPLQYIVGHTAFRELELVTDSRVLIPRPETEVLVEEVLEWAREARGGPAREPADPAAAEPAEGPAARGRHEEGPGLVALDVGTGSGCIALSLLVEGPFRRVVATDPSADALEVARENAGRADVEERVDLRAGSLYDPLGDDEAFDVVVSNPPYVATADRESLAPEVREWEPEGALFAGGEGMDVLAPLVDGAPAHVRPGGLLAVEVGLGQAARAAERIRETGAFDEPRIRRDLTGRERIVLALRREDGAGSSDARGGSGPPDARTQEHEQEHEQEQDSRDVDSQ